MDALMVAIYCMCSLTHVLQSSFIEKAARRNSSECLLQLRLRDCVFCSCSEHPVLSNDLISGPALVYSMLDCLKRPPKTLKPLYFYKSPINPQPLSPKAQNPKTPNPKPLNTYKPNAPCLLNARLSKKTTQNPKTPIFL